MHLSIKKTLFWIGLASLLLGLAPICGRLVVVVWVLVGGSTEDVPDAASGFIEISGGISLIFVTCGIVLLVVSALRKESSK